MTRRSQAPTRRAPAAAVFARANAAVALAAALALTAAAQAQGPAPAAPVATPAAPSSAAKRQLVARVVELQMPGIEQLARGLVEQPAVQMLREASAVLQERIPSEQREATGKRIQDATRKYVDEAAPLMRDRALKLAPSALSGPLEQQFSEDELRQLVAWLESPVSRKFQQVLPEMQNVFVQKLVADARPAVDPKLQTLEQNIRTALNLPTAGPGGAARPPAPASTPRPSASAPSAAPAAKPAGK